MNIQQLQITIDRVVKKEGISRIPAFWMHYILSSIAKELSIKVESSIYVTYYELLSLRAAGKLVPGQKYMITDYKTTTSQAFTKAASHYFNIIVEASDNYNLKEEASVSRSYNDNGYFAKSKLEAWKIWYCLDNDNTRFEWADQENGTGVIYRMIDEFGNDCPYDFKNIMFLRSKDWQNIHSDWFDVPGNYEDLYLYTFTGREYNIYKQEYGPFIDGSLKSPYLYRQDGHPSSTYYSNVIYKYMDIDDEKGIQSLNDNVFIGWIDKRGSDKTSSGNSYFAHYSHGNIIEGNHNTFGYSCNNNKIIGDNNIFMNECCRNEIYGGYNKFKNRCRFNITGPYYNDNVHFNDFKNNVFGDICYSNTFYDEVEYNHFGSNFIGNIIQTSCKYNTFKSDTVDNVIGMSSMDNNFGLYFMNNEFLGSNCIFGGFCKNNKFDNINGSTFDGYNEYLITSEGFCNFQQGLSGTANNPIEVNLNKSRNYLVSVGRDSFGNVKFYNEVDLIN